MSIADHCKGCSFIFLVVSYQQLCPVHSKLQHSVWFLAIVLCNPVVLSRLLHEHQPICNGNIKQEPEYINPPFLRCSVGDILSMKLISMVYPIHVAVVLCDVGHSTCLTSPLLDFTTVTSGHLGSGCICCLCLAYKLVWLTIISKERQGRRVEKSSTHSHQAPRQH